LRSIRRVENLQAFNAAEGNDSYCFHELILALELERSVSR
jgi:hypothetical protein